jgi:hypothetical protein
MCTAVRAIIPQGLKNNRRFDRALAKLDFRGILASHCRFERKETIMDTKQKMALTGTGLVAAGFGLGVVGVAMIAPAVFSWAAGLLGKGSHRFNSRLDDASRRMGTVVGTLQRSLSEATRAGVAEVKRAATGQSRIAS